MDRVLPPIPKDCIVSLVGFNFEPALAILPPWSSIFQGNSMDMSKTSRG